MAFESVRDGHGAIVDFCWTTANETACELVQRARDELLGRRLLEEMPGNAESGLFAAYCEVVETGVAHERVLHYEFDGFDTWFQLHATRLDDADGFLVLFVNITERVRSKRERDQARHRLQSVFEEAPFPVVLVRASDRTLISANRSAQKAFLRRLSPGDYAAELFQGFERHDELLSAFAQACESGSSHELLECARVRNGAAAASFNVAIHPVQDHDLVEVLAADVTELVEARRRVEEANRQKANALAVLGHELRNPLATISTALAAFEKGALPPEATAQIRETMKRQVDLSTRLLEDILDASRLARGKLTLNLQSVDLRELAQRATLDVASHQNGMVSLRQRWPPDAVEVHVDTVRLTQVVTNLVANAFKYTPAGTVTVELEVLSTAARLRITDTGVGIPAEDLPFVFEAFHQVDGHRSRAQGGLGLGLSLVQEFVWLHGGEVGVESDGEDRGSSFWFQLPLRPFTAESP